MRTSFALRARGFFTISTSNGTMTVRLQYEILSRWNGNHFGSSMTSTGITGTARHGIKPNSASMMRVKTLARSAPPRAQQRLAGAAHMIRVDRIADHLEREIGLHRRADVESAVAEQRPAAVIALDAAQIDRDLGFKRGIDRLAEIMPQQHVFGGNGGVGFEFEHPMAVRALLREQRLRRFLNVLLERAVERRSRRGLLRRTCLVAARLRSWPVRNNFSGAIARSDRAFDGSGQPGICPIAGKNEIAPLGCCAGTLASCAGVAAKVARRSRTICQGGSLSANSAGNPVKRATSLQIVLASSSRGESMSRSPALMVTDTRPGNAKIHCTVALSTPRIGGSAAGGSMRKCALTMARNSVGTIEPAHQRRGDIGRHRNDTVSSSTKFDGLAAEVESFDRSPPKRIARS